MSEIRVAWWNLENLFDHESAPRDPILAAALRDELKGWTAAIRDRKLDQLASVIKTMFGGAGPDLLGVCEVENEEVLKLLADRLTIPGRKYKVLTHDSADARGIDVSFLFDQKVLTASKPGHQVVLKRNATRDLFWATMTDKATKAVFAAMANHWPSRTEGQYESEPFREMTGETASFVLSRLLAKTEDPNLPVLLMGDFNDEPFNRSIQEYLFGIRDAEQVLRARFEHVFNLMWPLMAIEDPGTFRFGPTWDMLDQFLVSRGFLRKDSRVKVRPDSVAIFRPEEIRGSAGAPRPFGRPAKKLDEGGFSDHFPITLTLSATPES